MWGRAVLVVLAGALTSTPFSSSSSFVMAAESTSSESSLKIGRAINLFSRYGYLSISMRVVPRNDSDRSWVFREPTVDVFNNVDSLAINRRNWRGKKSLLFEGDFHMEFCDNLGQLLQAYFRDFTFERLERPWRAFTGSWAPEVMSKNLGINSSFVRGDHCYVLVRVSRFRESVKLNTLPKNIEISESVAEELNSIKVGDTPSVIQFIRKFGSHYIASYMTGNSLYQVFVYSRRVYNRIKERLKTSGVGALSSSELSSFFSPWYAEHMGKIKVASGNHTMEAWAASHLNVFYQIFSYTSLLKLHGDAGLLKALNNLLGNEALLQIDLKSLAPAFKDPAKRAWFQEVLDNNLKLWETNM